MPSALTQSLHSFHIAHIIEFMMSLCWADAPWAEISISFEKAGFGFMSSIRSFEETFLLCSTTNTAVQKFGVEKVFNAFERRLIYAYKGCISFNQKYCKSSNTVQYYYNLK